MMERRLARMPPGMWTRHFSQTVSLIVSFANFASFAVEKN
jgi:hypothetical protein